MSSIQRALMSDEIDLAKEIFTKAAAAAIAADQLPDFTGIAEYSMLAAIAFSEVEDGLPSHDSAFD